MHTDDVKIVLQAAKNWSHEIKYSEDDQGQEYVEHLDDAICQVEEFFFPTENHDDDIINKNVIHEQNKTEPLDIL